MPKNKINFDRIISRTKIYLIIIAVILLILCIIQPLAIIPSIIAFVLIVIYTIWTNQKRKAEISEHINELTLNIDKAAQSTIINSPFPLVVLETNGNIIWKSSKFIKEFANVDIGNYLNDIIKEFELRCSNGEKSKLRNFQQHKSHNLKNDEKFKLNSFYKEFWEYQRKKSGKLSYEENKKLKESMHDDSILWHLKQQALKQHSQSLEQTAEQVMGRTMTSFARNNKDTKQTAQNVILM